MVGVTAAIIGACIFLTKDDVRYKKEDYTRERDDPKKIYKEVTKVELVTDSAGVTVTDAAGENVTQLVIYSSHVAPENQVAQGGQNNTQQGQNQNNNTSESQTYNIIESTTEAQVWPTYNQDVQPGGGGQGGGTTPTYVYTEPATVSTTKSSGGSNKVEPVYGGQDGDYRYDRNSTGVVTITGYTGSGGDITIPSYIGGYAVSEIGSEAFLGKTSIRSITLPSTIVRVGYRAFAEISKNGSVTCNLPASCMIVGNGAFTGINVTNGNSAITADYGCLYSGSKLLCASGIDSGNGGHGFVTYSIKAGTTEIAPYAFAYISSYQAIAFPDSLNKLGDHAFYNCSNLGGSLNSDGSTKTLYIPKSVTYIPNYCLRGTKCSKIVCMYAGQEVISNREIFWESYVSFPMGCDVYAADGATKLINGND